MVEENFFQLIVIKKQKMTLKSMNSQKKKGVFSYITMKHSDVFSKQWEHIQRKLYYFHFYVPKSELLSLMLKRFSGWTDQVL